VKSRNREEVICASF